MQSTYSNFIGKYTGVFPEGFCGHLINEFEVLDKDGAGKTRKQSENALGHMKSDTQIFIGNGALHMRDFQEEGSSTDIFFKGLQTCYDEYIAKYSTLSEFRLRTNVIKFQRTDPGQGYHVWHCEQGNLDSASRVLVYLVYLNTLEHEEAGETEFLFQQTRERPVENTVLIWPASYTHTHRGNTVFGTKSKYIATGWFNLN